MSDLFGILSSTARSLEAQRMGLDVTGQNIANINTPGYSRRVVDIAAVPPPDRQSAGGGAEVQSIRSERDRLIERRLGLETSGAERYATMADELGMVESSLGTGDASLDTRLNDFFDSLSQLADRPTDAVEPGLKTKVIRHEVRISVADLERRARKELQRMRGCSVDDSEFMEACFKALLDQCEVARSAKGRAVATM